MEKAGNPTLLEGLRGEIADRPAGRQIRNYYKAEGLRGHDAEPNVIRRARAVQALFERHEKHIFFHDLVAGSYRGLLSEAVTAEQCAEADRIVGAMGERSFWTNYDHFAPDYETFLSRGVGGTIRDIDASLDRYAEEPDKTAFLQAARITMEALSAMIAGYAEAAEAKAASCAEAEDRARLETVGAACRAVVRDAPGTFREALQLMFLCHISFYYEGRYAMAFGRMDQILYPYYERDVRAGVLDRDAARELIACTLIKLREVWYFGGDDVCNIAIAGVKPEDGSPALNDLSYAILEAVGLCNIPGPNLSARLYRDVPEEFLDACLKVIGQGIGYPALMNDEVNIPALRRMGYAEEDCRNYCMVGCIENFLQGKQPPWSDGRFNTPLYLEYALNDGCSFLDGVQRGVKTGDAGAFTSMEQLLDAFRVQLEAGAKSYTDNFNAANSALRAEDFQSPYLSCFCRDCIGRGLDINRGGARYRTAHGACVMAIGTVADSLAAIDRLVFDEKAFTLSELRDALKADFAGYETLRQRLLAAPKYGNGDPLPDRYAVWFVDVQAEIFDRYRTPDGGRYYIAIASNVANIPAGLEVGATPDGRQARKPLSDAASPMHGMDRNGPTAVVLSCSKPDYTRAACGTVVNQKYSSGMFRDPEKRKKLAAMIRSYFTLGGQEMQINSVSRTTLLDAQAHPEQYGNLVVRVSGFSAYYTLLSREVQNDILARTEHE